MAIELVRITTRTGALRAAKWGAIACWLQVLRGTFRNVIQVAELDAPVDSAVVWFAGASIIPAILLVAGVRLWRGTGIVLGIGAVLLMMVDVLFYAPGLSSIAAIVASIVKIGIVILIANGVRGSMALKNTDFDAPMRRVFD